ncbi:MAG TPA: hypothetical protein VHH11_16725 [Gammaproteobacteria bacterium]|jgi:hypothetical protein|nr:hypothetical protein [Gammaproteobacteria bacterium]
MRAFLLAVVGAAALASLPAHADHRHWYPRPHVSFGYSYGYPFYPWGYYDPWYSPFWGPSVGLGVRIDRSQPRADQKAPPQALKLYVYPSAGQTEQQMNDDRYQCHVWAVDQSGYDPTLGTRGRADADGYTRAFTACMEGRNYVVK